MRSSDGGPAAMVDESRAGWEGGGHYGLWMIVCYRKRVRSPRFITPQKASKK